jgi:hypothetical protein
MRFTPLELSQERLKELFNLDPETGVFYWKTKTNFRILVGQVAGCLQQDGYWRISFDGRSYKRSRMVFFLCSGYSPPFVDHRNRIRHDDRPINLRAATRNENSVNKLSPRETLCKGVHLVKRSKGRHAYRAMIKVNGKNIHLGYFPTQAEAESIRQKAAWETFGEFAI